MKLSELIAKAQQILADHGECEVSIEYTQTDYWSTEVVEEDADSVRFDSQYFTISCIAWR